MRLAAIGVLVLLLATPLDAQETTGQAESVPGAGPGTAPAPGDRPAGFGRKPAERGAMHHGEDGSGKHGGAHHKRHHPPGHRAKTPTLKIAIERDGTELRFECGAQMPDCLEALDRVLGVLDAAE